MIITFCKMIPPRCWDMLMHEAEELKNVPTIPYEYCLSLPKTNFSIREEQRVCLWHVVFSSVVGVLWKTHLYLLSCTDFAKQSVNAGQIYSLYVSVAVGFINSSKSGTSSISVVYVGSVFQLLKVLYYSLRAIRFHSPK